MIEWQTFILAMLSAGGGGAAVALVALQWIGKSWVEKRLSERLENLRHEKAKELEAFRAEVSRSLQISHRYGDKRFESLDAIWVSLKAASRSVGSVVSPLQSYPSLRGLSDAARSALFERCNLDAWQVQKIDLAENPDRELQKVISANKFREAAAAFNDLEVLIRSREIYLEKEVFDKLTGILDGLHSTLVSSPA